MAENGHVQGILVAVFWDPGSEDPEDTEQFVKLSIKNATRRVKGSASTATVLYTKDGELIDDGTWAGNKVSYAVKDAAEEFIDNLKSSEEPLLR